MKSTKGDTEMTKARMTEEEVRAEIEAIEFIWEVQKLERKAWSKAEPMSEKRAMIDLKLEGLNLVQQAHYDKLHAHLGMPLAGFDPAGNEVMA